MTSVILIAKGSAAERLEKSISQIKDLNGPELIIIADPNLEPLAAGATLIPYDSENLSGSLKLAVNSSSGSKILLLDARAEISAEQLKSFAAETAELGDDSVLYASLENEDQAIDLSGSDGEGLLVMIQSRREWPAVCAAAGKDTLMNLPGTAFESPSEVIATLIIRASAAGQSVNAFAEPVGLDSKLSLELSDAAAARCLSEIVSGFLIEDIFPAHAWQDHSEESAAASYHSLAALFIGLKDLPSAMECLRLSDQLEESPRSTALKGLIARTRGETLGAVANMVSSLQQYEVRKKSTEHYVSFNPRDLEKINSHLESGLDALNKRDNETALEFFSRAVFNFDEFYEEFGLSRPK